MASTGLSVEHAAEGIECRCCYEAQDDDYNGNQVDAMPTEHCDYRFFCII